VESPAKYSVTGSLGEVVEAPLLMVLLLAPPPPVPMVAVVPPAPPVPMALDSVLEPVVAAATTAVLLAPPALALELLDVLLETADVPLVLATAVLAITDAVVCVLVVEPACVDDDAESLLAGPPQATLSPTKAQLGKYRGKRSIRQKEGSHSVAARANTKFSCRARQALVALAPSGNCDP